MSYCNPTHVSDYVWNRVLNYIETISGWGAPSEPPGGRPGKQAARCSSRSAGPTGTGGGIT